MAKNSGRSLVIHIGQHKTGSTAIQQNLNMLARNDDFHYIETCKRYSGHHGFYDALKRKPNHDVVLSKVSSEVAVSNSSRFFISSEYLSSDNELAFDMPSMLNVWSGLEKMSDIFSHLIVVYYVRDQVSSIESRINQGIKSRLCLSDVSLDRFYNNASLDYDDFDNKLRGIFGEKVVIVPRVFSRDKLVGNDICKDFAELFGIQAKVSSSGVNRSLNYDQLMGCLDVNKLDIEVDEKMKLKKAIIARSRVNTSIDNEKDGVLTKVDKENIRKKYEKSNRSFFSKYPDLSF